MSGLLKNVASGDELATLLLPVTGTKLVLPNVTVAEIIPYVEPEVVDGKPSWYLGNLNWRNESVPLVCYEEINDKTYVAGSDDRRIAVLNGLIDSQRLPFCAIVISGVPHLMRVLPSDIVNDEEVPTGPAELSSVLIGGEKAVIPNVDWIQEQVLGVL